MDVSTAFWILLICIALLALGAWTELRRMRKQQQRRNEMLDFANTLQIKNLDLHRSECEAQENFRRSLVQSFQEKQTDVS